MRLKSTKVNSFTDVIADGVKHIAAFGNDDLIPHFITCHCYSGYWQLVDEKTLKEIFLEKMRKYGIRSAILTKLYLKRWDLRTKEEVKQKYLDVREAQLKKDKGENVYVERLLSDDLESFYTSLQNPERPPKAGHSYIFLMQKLTEEDVTLVENRNNEYLSTFVIDYNRDNEYKKTMEKFKESSDPESMFSYSYGRRSTSALHVTLKSVQEEMRKRASNEDLSDMKLKKQRVNWYNRSQLTYKFIKKEET